ncbi:MAG: FTR1 family protein [Demequinaceae bacterium]|nr:FTR1 family protein [Demequinaceae bacterium]
MIANYVLGLREGLEAALIIGVLIAYLLRTNMSTLLAAVWGGLGAAVGFSLAVGVILTFGQQRLPAEATEAVAGVAGLAATALMTWMVFWMARTSRSLRGRLEDSLGRAVGLGRWAVFSLAFLAVGREGLEIALFLWTQVSAARSAPAALGGAVLGIFTAVALGWAIYRGAVRINLARFFTWTGLFLILLAAGVLAHAIHELQESGIVRGFESVAFDVSAQVPESSWHGAVLKGIFGFLPAPSVLEFLAWLAYLAITLTAFVRVFRRGASNQARRLETLSPVSHHRRGTV